MASYGLLGQPEEDALHKSRLLNVEEKPFKRIAKRLLNPESLISDSSLPLTPPPDESDIDPSTGADAKRQKRIEEWRTFREDVALDFAAFEGSIARIQFLLTSNEAERQRYASEKLAILDTMQSVRQNTIELRSQLEEAQRLLALRKTYDDLADKITSNRLLKPREDQQANLQKLQSEITELEKESKDYATTWAERREQFGRIVDEGMQLRRLIRDEKEEVERREGMQEGGDADEGDATSKGKPSAANSPVPDGDDATPSQHSQDEGGRLQVEKASGATGAASPLRQAVSAETEKGGEGQEDTNMADEGEVTAEDAGEVSEGLEEGEELPDERMDTS
ncbi:hypothetical protein POX_f08235 [Penicillium oxalicum]|uniref:Tho complex subunit 7/Mft1p n=1 Tax=Penicillium oxalicum (strain 114-2 / CGMCC 5302) TaxID=933388 RepID=S8B3S8_PENO1|nr:hypothetical protein POX_f08235 [Penicillium oxalicum]EPS29187.1 hypothetical protein PDE_04136 [Penicillium oxalicum 114-2]KAI2787857.1 hypothetical protein POX_f08235 [Penicillium oxalicum]